LHVLVEGERERERERETDRGEMDSLENAEVLLWILF